MLDKVHAEANDPPAGDQPTEAQFPFTLVGTQERYAALFTRLNELMVKTARSVWESQTELLRLETEQAAKALALPKIGEDPGETISCFCGQLHERSDRMIAQMRRINDVYKDFGWQLMAIYFEGFRQTPKPPQAPPRA